MTRFELLGFTGLILGGIATLGCLMLAAWITVATIARWIDDRLARPVVASHLRQDREPVATLQPADRFAETDREWLQTYGVQW